MGNIYACKNINNSFNLPLILNLFKELLAIFFLIYDWLKDFLNQIDRNLNFLKKKFVSKFSFKFIFRT